MYVITYKMHDVKLGQKWQSSKRHCVSFIIDDTRISVIWYDTEFSLDYKDPIYYICGFLHYRDC